MFYVSSVPRKLVKTLAALPAFYKLKVSYHGKQSSFTLHSTECYTFLEKNLGSWCKKYKEEN